MSTVRITIVLLIPVLALILAIPSKATIEENNRYWESFSSEWACDLGLEVEQVSRSSWSRHATCTMTWTADAENDIRRILVADCEQPMFAPPSCNARVSDP